jgi:DNA-binding phage protein
MTRGGVASRDPAPHTPSMMSQSSVPSVPSVLSVVKAVAVRLSEP